MDDDWTVVRRNSQQMRRFWKILGKILQKEGADSKVTEIFYREVLQLVLLLRSESSYSSSGAASVSP